MKKLGYLIITVGFLAGALVAVLDELNVQWGFFSGALAVGTVGIVMVHAGERRSNRSEEKLASNIQDVKTSLAHIVENMAHLNREKQSINPYDMRYRIDELFGEDLTTFVEARQSLAQVHGLQVYADVMSYFASGERYLNRVWSASADGYINEVDAYLAKAQSQFVEAFEKVSQLKE